MSKYQNKYRIESTRLNGWDYSSNGHYFITICTKNRDYFLGEITNSKMKYSKSGEIANQYWSSIPDHFSNVELDAFQIMPNHIHGIIIINNENRNVNGNRIYNGPYPEMSAISPKPKSLPVIIGSYKSIVKKTINRNYPVKGFKWQHRFHDHIIRNENELNRIRKYIRENPMKWEMDKNNMENIWM
jgi:REP element-mobilizing transposase RayT